MSFVNRGEILYIVPAQTIIVQEGTAFASVPLPGTVDVVTVDDEAVTTDVTWSSVGYNGNTPGFYVLDGSPLGFNNPLGVKAHIEVVVSHLTNEHIYYDFSKLTEADEAIITTLTDQCGNFNATGVNDPQCEILFDNEAAYPGIKVFRDIGLRGFDMGTSGDNGIADQNIVSWQFCINTLDGIQTNGIQIFAGRTSDTNITFNCIIDASGNLVVNWGYASNRFTYTVNSYLVNGENQLLFGRVVMDFTADTVTVYRNQRTISGSFTLSTIVGKNPASYSNTANLYLGVSNQNGTPAGDNTTASYFHKFAFTTEKTQEESLDIEKEWIKGIFDGWRTEFRTSTGNVTVKRAAIIDHIFNGNGYPATTNFEDRTLNYVGANMHEVPVASLVGAGQVSRIVHEVTDNDGWTWTYYTYLIRNSGTFNGKLFIDHKGHGSEGGTTHLNMINDILAAGFDVLLVAMPKGDNTNTDNTIEVGNPYTRGHEDLYNEGLDDGVYSPLHLFFEATVRALNHVLANPSDYNTYTEVNAVGLSGGGWSVTWLAAMDTRITRTYCDRGINLTSWKQYPFNVSTQNSDYEQNPSNGFDTNVGPANFAFYAEHTTMDAILLAVTGGRRYMQLSHTEDPTIVQGGYGHMAWESVMMKKAIEMGGSYELFLNTISNQEAHLYQAAERAAIIADLP